MVFTDKESDVVAESEVFTFTNGNWIEQVDGKFILHFEGDGKSQERVTSPKFNEGDRVEYAEGKVGVVIGLVPAPPKTDDPHTENLWKELINRAVMEEYEEVRLADGEIINPQYVVRRETGVTTVFRADELNNKVSKDENEGGYLL